ncbi:hypothetical protein GQ600_13998 [Phytophthora cactorum]|nr:hypothetical protein GQ600_13998 [Phytophthora cactorum]
MFADVEQIDIHINMNASNGGLVVFNRAPRQYLQVQFDEEERQLILSETGPDGFNISVREHLCLAFGAWCFGHDRSSLSASPTLFRSWVAG